MIMKYRASRFLVACFWKDEDVPLILSVKKTEKITEKKKVFNSLLLHSDLWFALSKVSKSSNGVILISSVSGKLTEVTQK